MYIHNRKAVTDPIEALHNYLSMQSVTIIENSEKTTIAQIGDYKFHRDIDGNWWAEADPDYVNLKLRDHLEKAYEKTKENLNT